jgi:hypothetical protein
MFTEPHGKSSSCFANVVRTTFTENAVDTVQSFTDLFFSLDFINEILKVYLIYKMLLMSYRFPIRLDLSETPFTQK